MERIDLAAIAAAIADRVAEIFAFGDDPDNDLDDWETEVL